jgi:hypothetical protein
MPHFSNRHNRRRRMTTKLIDSNYESAPDGKLKNHQQPRRITQFFSQNTESSVAASAHYGKCERASGQRASERYTPTSGQSTPYPVAHTLCEHSTMVHRKISTAAARTYTLSTHTRCTHSTHSPQRQGRQTGPSPPPPSSTRAAYVPSQQFILCTLQHTHKAGMYGVAQCTLYSPTNHRTPPSIHSARPIAANAAFHIDSS